MADHSKIEWTDATWNIVTGCSVTSPGCTNCYAMKLAGTRLKHHPSREGLTRDTKAGPVWTGETRVNWEWIDQPLSWAKPRNIFVCAHGDLFHDTVPWEDIATIYGVMIAAHHFHGHTLQVLTKRSARARELLSREDFWDLANAHASAKIMDRVDCLNRRSDDARATCDDYGPSDPPPGIWVGVSVEDQARADERIPDLLATPAAVRWLSCEPLLGALDLTNVAGKVPEYGTAKAHGTDVLTPHNRILRPQIDWVVVGGESGPGARPMHPDWARSLRDQCAAAGVPFFFKQWGEWAPEVGAVDGWSIDDDPEVSRFEHRDWENDHWGNPYTRIWCDDVEPDTVSRIGKKRAGRLLDGVEHNELPA